MGKYVVQYGSYFYTLIKTTGYSPLFAGTPLSDKEWQKLFYAGQREKKNSISSSFMVWKVTGNASELLGREVKTMNIKKDETNDKCLWSVMEEEEI